MFRYRGNLTEGRTYQEARRNTGITRQLSHSGLIDISSNDPWSKP